MDATTLAHELLGIQESAHLVPPFSARHPGLTAEQGYAAARKLHAHRCARGWKPVGRKIGFTNRTLWARYGVYEPMWGTVYDRTIVFSEAGKSTVSLAGLAQPRIEPEICFRLRSAPRSSDPRALLAAIEWMAHSIEIVQCHHPDWKVTIADCTADNGLHGKLVVGEPFAIEGFSDLIGTLPKAKVKLYQGNTLKDQGVGANVLGSPLASLGFLVDVLAKQPESPPLAAGEIVTTGVLTDAHPVKPGEKWSTSFEGVSLPGMEIDFQ
ncbi:MAG: decarboxylase [Pseudomonadota bacterium]